FLLSFYCSHDLPVLHSFPTRRSSDLCVWNLDKFVERISFKDALHELEEVWTRPCVIQHFKTLGYEFGEHRWYGTVLDFDKAAIEDRKSTRLNSSHVAISYAVFCLKKK